MKGLGEATFVQAAGFLKIDDGENPLDATWVHPESYEVARRLLAELGIELDQVGKENWAERFAEAVKNRDRAELATKLELGEHTLGQLIEALERPGRDLRADLPPPVFRRDVVKLDDLSVGMKLRGTVLNVVDFGDVRRRRTFGQRPGARQPVAERFCPRPAPGRRGRRPGRLLGHGHRHRASPRRPDHD